MRIVGEFNDFIKKTGGLLTIVVASIGIGAIVFSGGGMATEVRAHGVKITDHEARITRVEQTGSVGLASHERYDDERLKAMEHRMSMVEAAALTLPEIRIAVEKIDGKITSLQKQLEFDEKNRNH